MAKGYTHIDNDILRGLARLRISGATFNVLMAIISNTLSFHRRQHELSNSFLMNATGLRERTVIRAIQELSDKGIITIVYENIGSHPRTVKLLTDKIVTLTKMSVGTDKNVSNSTDKNVSILTDNPVSQEIKEENKEIKEEERDFSFSSERRLTLEELAAKSWAEEDDEEGDDGNL